MNLHFLGLLAKAFGVAFCTDPYAMHPLDQKADRLSGEVIGADDTDGPKNYAYERYE